MESLSKIYKVSVYSEENSNLRSSKIQMNILINICLNHSLK